MSDCTEILFCCHWKPEIRFGAKGRSHFIEAWNYSSITLFSSSRTPHLNLSFDGWCLNPTSQASVFFLLLFLFCESWYVLIFLFVFLHQPIISTFHALALCLSVLYLQVFHYYAPVLDLVQLVNLSDLPSFLMSSTQFELYPYFLIFVFAH